MDKKSKNGRKLVQKISMIFSFGLLQQNSFPKFYIYDLYLIRHIFPKKFNNFNFYKGEDKKIRPPAASQGPSLTVGAFGADGRKSGRKKDRK